MYNITIQYMYVLWNDHCPYLVLRDIYMSLEIIPVKIYHHT